jgi:hypothetical protein
MYLVTEESPSAARGFFGIFNEISALGFSSLFIFDLAQG